MSFVLNSSLEISKNTKIRGLICLWSYEYNTSITKNYLSPISADYNSAKNGGNKLYRQVTRWLNLAGLMNSVLTRAAGPMVRKLDFINKFIDPVKNIEIDRVNF